MFYILYFIYGTAIGSFVNVCIHRLPLKQSVISPPSHCPQCSKRIKAFDLIPVIGYLALGGHCRNCDVRISPLYPAIELLNGCLYCLCLYFFGLGIRSVIMCLFFSALTCVFVTDLRHRIIPDSVNLFIAGLGFLALFLHQPFWYYLLGAVIVSAPMLAVAMLTNGFGGGDVKLFAAAGLLLGAKCIGLAAFIAVFTGGIAGILLLATKKLTPKSQLPFAPFIVIGIFISALWGDLLIDWYLGLFWY